MNVRPLTPLTGNGYAPPPSKGPLLLRRDDLDMKGGTP